MTIIKKKNNLKKQLKNVIPIILLCKNGLYFLALNNTEMLSQKKRKKQYKKMNRVLQ